MANSRVEAQDEQEFLKAHHETLQKDREKDPRAAFAARLNVGDPSQNGGEGASYSTSVVGPMASTSLSLPSVERALERDPEDVTARMVKNARRVRSSPCLLLPPHPHLLLILGPAGIITKLGAVTTARLVDVPLPNAGQLRNAQRQHLARASFAALHNRRRGCTRRAGLERSARQLLSVAPRRAHDDRRRKAEWRHEPQPRWHIPDPAPTAVVRDGQPLVEPEWRLVSCRLDSVLD